MIHLDRSPSKTVVITCDECAFWSAIRFGLEEAYECAEQHEALMHPGEQRARQTAREWRRRNLVTRR